MRRRVLWISFVLLACTNPSIDTDPRQPTPGAATETMVTETAILALADSLFAAAQARDAYRFASMFSGRPDFVYLINTRLLPSRDSVRATFAGMLSRQQRFEPKWGSRSVQIISPSIAILTGAFETVAQRASGESWEANGVVTFVAVKEPNGWRIVNWHTTE
jgi:uncharacterized protein (TIGR02246 family)